MAEWTGTGGPLMEAFFRLRGMPATPAARPTPAAAARSATKTPTVPAACRPPPPARPAAPIPVVMQERWWETDAETAARVVRGLIEGGLDVVDAPISGPFHLITAENSAALMVDVGGGEALRQLMELAKALGDHAFDYGTVLVVVFLRDGLDGATATALAQFEAGVAHFPGRVVLRHAFKIDDVARLFAASVTRGASGGEGARRAFLATAVSASRPHVLLLAALPGMNAFSAAAALAAFNGSISDMAALALRVTGGELPESAWDAALAGPHWGPERRRRLLVGLIAPVGLGLGS